MKPSPYSVKECTYFLSPAIYPTVESLSWVTVSHSFLAVFLIDIGRTAKYPNTCNHGDYYKRPSVFLPKSHHLFISMFTTVSTISCKTKKGNPKVSWIYNAPHTDIIHLTSADITHGCVNIEWICILLSLVLHKSDFSYYIMIYRPMQRLFN